jgi:hypothetical protein
MHAHKFSLVWLGESIVDLSELRAEYIGSERVGKFQYGALPEKPEHIIHQLAERDKAKAGILRKYFIEQDFRSLYMHLCAHQCTNVRMLQFGHQIL